MSITQTFTVSMTGSLGAKKYVIDGVQQPRINLVRGGLYVFDVSDSSNTSQALRFSTTSNGTHAGGTIYTTGVSQNLGGGNPGAKIEFQVASDAPSSLHYFDVNAGTNAGGEINTLLGSTYGTPPWNVNSWGSDELIVSLSAPEAASALGTPQSFNLEGWSRQQWGNSGWGVEYSVEPTGVSATVSLGTAEAAELQLVQPTGLEATASTNTLSISTSVELSGQQATVSLGDSIEFNETGWGRISWGIADWGEGADETVSVSGLEATASPGSITTGITVFLEMVGPNHSMTTSVGNLQVDGEIVVPLTGVQSDFATPTMSYVGTLVGWGRDSWGDNSWGESPDQVIPLVGREITSSVGSISPADVVGISGQEATTNVGSVDFVISPTVSLTGISSTSSLGTIGLEFGPAAISGVSATSNVGTLGLEFGPAEITGVSATASVGSPEIGPITIVDLNGVSATASVGSISPADVVGLSSVSATASVGSITPADIVMGLTSDQITSSVGSIGIQAYGNIDTGSNTSYSDITTGSNNTYSDVATGSNTSYSDVA